MQSLLRALWLLRGNEPLLAAGPEREVKKGSDMDGKEASVSEIGSVREGEGQEVSKIGDAVDENSKQ